MAIVALTTGACEGGPSSPMTGSVQPSQSPVPESATPSAGSATDGQLGPLAEQPTIPDGSTGLGLSVPFEILLEPREQQWVDFPPEPLAEEASCADGSISFTWSARQPYPSDTTLVEFFNERMGAHVLLGTANVGSASVSYCTPVSIVSRSDSRVLVEIRSVYHVVD